MRIEMNTWPCQSCVFSARKKMRYKLVSKSKKPKELNPGCNIFRILVVARGTELEISDGLLPLISDVCNCLCQDWWKCGNCLRWSISPALLLQCVWLNWVLGQSAILCKALAQTEPRKQSACVRSPVTSRKNRLELWTLTGVMPASLMVMF